MANIVHDFTKYSHPFIVPGCIILGTIGTAVDNLWHLSAPEGPGAANDTGGGGGLGFARAILVPLIVLDVFIFLNVLYFLRNACKAYRNYSENFRNMVIKRNKNPMTGKSTNQVALLSPFLRLVGLYVDTVVMLVTGLVIACVVGLCILALIALALAFFTLISFIPRTSSSQET